MIKFHDLSHWNNDIQFQNAIQCPIIAHKITEGKSFIDPAIRERAKSIPQDKVLILYHFLHAADNTAAVEMGHFLKTVKNVFGGRPVVLALDFETPYMLNDRTHFDFLAQCLAYVTTHTGKEPYVYINQSQLSAAERLGYRYSWLWIAKWSKTPPAHDCGIWQYSNKVMDMDADYFMTDDIALLKRHEVIL